MQFNRNEINEDKSIEENLIDYNSVFRNPKDLTNEDQNKTVETEFTVFKRHLDNARSMTEILNIIKIFSIGYDLAVSDEQTEEKSDRSTPARGNHFTLPENFNACICEKIKLLKNSKNDSLTTQSSIIDNKIETEILSFLSRDIQTRSDQFLKSTKTDKISTTLGNLVAELATAQYESPLNFSNLNKQEALETLGMQRVIDPLALARSFSIKTKSMNPIPKPFSFNLRMSLSAYIDTTLLQKREQKKAKATAIKENEIVERDRFKVTVMSGSDKQERRKQELFQKIVDTCKKAKIAAIPFLFVTITPNNFSQSIQNTFDVIQLFSDGLITIRYTTDQNFAKRVYEAHEYEIISTQLLDKLYICPKELVKDNFICDTEFTPVEWKSLTSILSFTADICDDIVSKFNIQSPFQLNEWIDFEEKR